MSKLSRIGLRLVKIGLWTLGIIFFIFVVITILIQLPAVHRFALGKAETYFHTQTNGYLNIAEIDLRLPGYLALKKVQISNPDSGTFAVIEDIKVSIGWRKLLGQEVVIDRFFISGLDASVWENADSVWNYQWIVDGFNSTDTAAADTSSSNWRIKVGLIQLEQINFRYGSEVSLDSMHLAVQSLTLKGEDISLTENIYLIDDLELAQTAVYYRIGKSTEAAADSSALDEAIKLSSGLNRLALTDLDVRIEMLDSSFYAVTLGALNLESDVLDYTKNAYHLSSLDIKSLDFNGWSKAPTMESTEPTELFLPVDILVSELELSEINVVYGDPQDPEITLSNLNINGSGLLANNAAYEAKLNVSAGEYGGYPFPDELRADIKLTSKVATVNELFFRSGQSTFQFSANAVFDDFQKSLESYDHRSLEAKLDFALADHNDLSFINAFYPLDSIRQFFPDERVELALNANSNGKQLSLTKMNIKTGQTSLDLLGTAGLKTRERIDISKLALNFVKSDWDNLFAYYQLDSLAVPASIGLNGQGSYSPSAIHADVKIRGSLGDLLLTADGKKTPDGKLPAHFTVDSDTLTLATLLDPARETSLKIKMEADIGDIYNPMEYFAVKGNLPFALYGNINLHEMAFDAELKDSLYRAQILFTDSFLVGQISASGSMMATQKIKIQSEIKGADLLALGLSKNDLRVAFSIDGDFTSDSTFTELHAAIAGITLVSNADRYDLKPIKIAYTSNLDSTSAIVESSILSLNGLLRGSVTDLQTAWIELLAGKTDTSLAANTYFRLDFDLVDRPELRELLLPDLTRLEEGKGHILIDEAEQNFEAAVFLPGITYGNISVDSLSLYGDTQANGVQFNLNIKRAAYDTLALESIRLKSLRSTYNSKIYFSIDNPYTDVLDLKIAANLTRDENQPKQLALLQIDTLLFGKNEWVTDNSRTKWDFESPTNSLYFALAGSDQSISIESEPKIFNAKLNGFELAQLGQLFATPKNPLVGSLTATINSLPEGEMEGNGNLTGVKVAEIDLGKIDWEFESRADYVFADISARGEDIDFAFSGTTKTENSIQSQDFKGKINRFNLEALQLVPGDYITESSGRAEGQFSISGSSAKPTYSAQLRFIDGVIRSSLNGARYRLPNEKISLTDNKVQFNQFTLIDDSQNKLEINGSVGIGQLDFGNANLNIVAKNFTLLNLEETQSPTIYGVALADIDLQVTGALDAPRIKSTIKIAGETDLSYLVSNDSDIETIDEELLVWVEMDAESDSVSQILLRKTKDLLVPSVFQNTVDFNGSVEINKSAKFTIVIDTVAGDFLQIQGGGKLAVNYDRAGNLSLNGTYEVNEGFYQLTLYNFLKKKFDIKKGSTVTWNGNAMEANLSIKASYRTRVSIKNLMSSADETNAATTQQLPFEIAMSIDGDLNKPIISFEIKLEESSRGALGGSVEAKLKQINDNENERNKQVVAILVLNSFISTDGGGSDNLVANQARNSASELLTNELNALSDRFLKGVDLNFDLQSYGGNAGEGNTDLTVDLAKTFLDDRIIVRVGSTIALETNEYNSSGSNFLTNVVVEYKLTDDGRYRFKAYSKTDLEDIVVGRITRTGVGILFRRDFDQWRYLLKTDPELKRSEPIEPDSLNQEPEPTDEP